MAVGPAEILVILIVALLVFGPERLPEVGRQVGAAVRELRRMQDTVRGELDMVLHPEHGTSPTNARADSGPEADTGAGAPRADDVTTEPGDHTTLPSAPVADDGFSGPDSFI